MVYSRKAQAAVIGVLLIGVLIVGYLTLLPKDDKCKVMPDLEECKGTSNLNLPANALLAEQPGSLQPIEDSVEYNIGSIDLFTRETTEIPFSISLDPTVEKAWFRDKKITQEFEVPGKVKRVILFVGIAESEGVAALGIVVNGETVGRVAGAGLHTVEIPAEVIKRTNTLEIVSSTPWIPGVTNSFKLNYLTLKETYTTTQPTIERNFIIEQNINDVLSATLTFTADCYSKDDLVIKMNGYTIVNEKICTDYTNDVISALNRSNVLEFSSDGNYFIHNLKLKVKFEEKDYTTYYFAVDKENFDKIDEGRYLAMLKLRFPDTARKDLTVYINGNPISIDTSNLEYKTAVGPLLKKGQNSLKIVPGKKVSIGSLSIELE